ncbi:uncharacterized protein LOC109056711 isoform X1 [Cyprinus carpio]|uniref:Uncharacterized protein LOC109056711 isoform X1 n=1 Tax=Cyprinus carpio TaxID=7962 RepID=A0A9Q9Z501_CYPCA|nr:uncharacterized protein LOC109056711 isoform X1 [Cyprinus carpio]
MQCVTATGNRKIIFGSGTRLTVETKKEEPPVYYKFDESCLATDFTKYDAVKFQNVTPVRYAERSYYSSYAFNVSDCPQKDCQQGSSSQNDDFEPDEKTNYMSLGLYWLRILFLKTVVFNVLMTFKAWMS